MVVLLLSELNHCWPLPEAGADALRWSHLGEGGFPFIWPQWELCVSLGTPPFLQAPETGGGEKQTECSARAVPSSCHFPPGPSWKKPCPSPDKQAPIAGSCQSHPLCLRETSQFRHELVGWVALKGGFIFLSHRIRERGSFIKQNNQLQGGFACISIPFCAHFHSLALGSSSP